MCRRAVVRWWEAVVKVAVAMRSVGDVGALRSLKLLFSRPASRGVTCGYVPVDWAARHV